MSKRHIHTAFVESVPPISAYCQMFLCSEPFCRLLAHVTGLDLARNVVKPPIEDDSSGSSVSDDDYCENDQQDTMAAVVPDDAKHTETSQHTNVGLGEKESNNPVALCHAQIQHWQPGDYTLISDTDPEIGEYALDAVAYFCCEGKLCVY